MDKRPCFTMAGMLSKFRELIWVIVLQLPAR